MIKTINKSLLLLLLTVLTASCLRDKETVSTPECSITSFSIGSISSQVAVKKSDGTDTTITRSITGSTIKFNIDQLNGLIYNVDTLPKWTDVTKICPSFTVSGTAYARLDADSIYYQMTSGSDSIDFTNPIQILVLAYDGMSQKEYTAKITLAATDQDTLVWDNVDAGNIVFSNKKKALFNGGKIYVFSENAEGNTQVATLSTTTAESRWSSQTDFTSEAKIDYSSVLIYKDCFYGLGTDRNIYKSTGTDASTWTKMTENGNIDCLLASDAFRIYAVKGDKIVSTTDFSDWAETETSDFEYIPRTCINCNTYTSKTNGNIQIAVMTGIASTSASQAVSWYKVSAEDAGTDQNWMYIGHSGNNLYNMPSFTDMSATRYDGQLYAIGTETVDGASQYRYLYCSPDNGIAWQPQKSKYPLPEALNASNGTAQMVSDGTHLWIIQNGTHVWKGTIK